MSTVRKQEGFFRFAWVKKMFGLHRPIRGRRVLRRGRIPQVEILEDRTTPAAVLGASMTDVLVLDADSDGQADPGDQIRYTVTISNTGDQDALNTALAIVLDANAPEPGASNSTLKIGPLARRDTFNAVGNTQLTGNLRANDVDLDGVTPNANLVVTAVTNAATSQGGSITVAADGAFTYTPQTGDRIAADTFVYTLTDGDGLVGTGTVTFNLNNSIVWYVDSNYAGANGTEDGSSFRPYNSFADISGASGGDAINETIFVRERAGDYTDSLTLLNGQKLYGGGSALTVNSVAIHDGSGGNTTAGPPRPASIPSRWDRTTRSAASPSAATRPATRSPAPASAPCWSAASPSTPPARP